MQSHLKKGKKHVESGYNPSLEKTERIPTFSAFTQSNNSYIKREQCTSTLPIKYERVKYHVRVSEVVSVYIIPGMKYHVPGIR